MSSSIDATKPQQGSASTANVRSNFAAAVSEIEALQNATGVGGGSGGSVAITAGSLIGVTLDNSVIGGSTAAAGTFTTLTGTTIDGVIGSVTPAAATVTTLATSGAVTFNDAGADVDFRVESTGSANMLTVDAGNDRLLIGGNVGIGVTPEAWQSGQTSLQVGGLGSLWATTSAGAGSTTTLSNNLYYDGAYKAIVTDEICRVEMKNGEFKIYTATSTTQDTTPAAWVVGMTVKTSGYVDFNFVDLELQAAQSTGTVNTAAGYITVEVGGATRYIPLYSAVT